MPIKYLPKAVVSVVIGVVLFLRIMPDSIKGMPEWVFYSKFALSLLVGWLVATGLFKAFRWYLNRMNH